MDKNERRLEDRTSLTDRKMMRSTNISCPAIKEEDIDAEILNVSSGGFCLSVAKPLEEFGVIRALIPLSKDLPPIPVLGKIRWVRPESAKVNRYTVGLSFIV